MLATNQERMLSHAMYALRKIANRLQPFGHKPEQGEHCICPQAAQLRMRSTRSRRLRRNPW